MPERAQEELQELLSKYWQIGMKQSDAEAVLMAWHQRHQPPRPTVTKEEIEKVLWDHADNLLSFGSRSQMTQLIIALHRLCTGAGEGKQSSKKAWCTDHMEEDSEGFVWMVTPTYAKSLVQSTWMACPVCLKERPRPEAR